METTQDAGNPPAENSPVPREPFDWRERLYEILRDLPYLFVCFRVLEFGAVAFKLDFKGSRDYPSVLLGAASGVIVYELIKACRRNKREGEVVGSTSSGEITAHHSRFLPPFEGGVPLALLIQALGATASVHTVYVLFWCWAFNQLPGSDIPYLYAFAYGWPLALVGFYGKKADNFLRVSYSWIKDAFRDPSGKPREVVDWSELRKASIATTVCIGIAYFSLYKASVEDRPVWAWGVVFGSVMLVLIVTVLTFSRSFGKQKQQPGDRSDSLL